MSTGSEEWAQRWDPLDPVGVIGPGSTMGPLAVAGAAARRSGRELRAAVSGSCLLLMGPADSLPWVDGVTYVGWDSGLLMSTTHVTTVHPDLFRQALVQRHGRRAFAVLPGHVFAYELSVGPVDMKWLEAVVGAVSA